MVQYPADVTDANGKVWSTVGENIRHGAHSVAEGVYNVIAHITYNGADWTATLSNNESNVSDLVCNVDESEIYLTSSTVDLINIKDFEIKEVAEVTGSNFALARGLILATTKQEALQVIPNNITALDVSIKIMFKVGEY